VAHEINNPLGIILGYAGHLEKKLGKDDPNFTFIHEIKQEGKRCKKIVQNLLNYSRTPRPVLELTDINKLDTTALIISKDAEKVASALNSAVADHAFELPGVVSRKKQIIPFLQSAFEA